MPRRARAGPRVLAACALVWAGAVREATASAAYPVFSHGNGSAVLDTDGKALRIAAAGSTVRLEAQEVHLYNTGAAPWLVGYQTGTPRQPLTVAECAPKPPVCIPPGGDRLAWTANTWECVCLPGYTGSSCDVQAPSPPPVSSPSSQTPPPPPPPPPVAPAPPPPAGSSLPQGQTSELDDFPASMGASIMAGSSVAISANAEIIVVGAPHAESGTFAKAGAVAVYKRSGSGSTDGKYTLHQIIEETYPFLYDYMGSAVAVTGNGDTIYIGAPYEDTNYIVAGAVYIWQRSASGQYERTYKWTPSPAKDYDYFGTSVSAASSAKAVVIGSYRKEVTVRGKNVRSGLAYVVEDLDPDTLTTLSLLDAGETPLDGDEFGKATSITADGAAVAIAAARYSNTNKGAVFVFKRLDRKNWEFVQKLVDPARANWRYFGQSVAMSGDGTVIAVGVPLYDFVVVFERQSDGTFSSRDDRLVKGRAGSGATLYGQALSLSHDGSLLAIGIPHADGRKGTVAVLSLGPDGKFASGDVKSLSADTDNARKNLLGSAVAITTDAVGGRPVVVAGAPGPSGGGGDGRALVFA